MRGPIDLEHNFRASFENMCCGEDRKSAACSRALRLILEIETALESGKGIDANVSGYWREVYSVAMYDGWPYWKPMPAVCVSGTLGPEYHFFYDLLDVRQRKSGEAR